MHAVYCNFTLYFVYKSKVVTFILKFGGDLELKRLDLTWSGQVDLTATTLRSSSEDGENLKVAKM